MPASTASSKPPRESLNSLLRATTVKYIKSLDKNNPPSAQVFEQGLMEVILSAVLLRNSSAPKEDQWHAPAEMEPAQVALALIWMKHFCRIDFSDGEEQEVAAFPLHVYDEKRGIYVEVDDDMLGKLVREYRFTASPAFVQAVHAVLREESPIKTRTRDANLDVVNNGIRDRMTGQLMDFSPNYVFTCKTAVDWNPNAKNVTIVADDGYEWDVESAFLEFAGNDVAVSEYLWRVVAASLRPNVRWDKSVWFYSKTGNNGKGTLCQLVRNLVGPGNHTSIPFADFNNSHFMLGALPRVQAVICDENQVGKYADDNAEFKAAVTNDVFRIDRKHKPPISARFYGLIIECVNEIPRIRDRSDSFWRRVSVVHFDKCFTGIERPEIKHDYIARKEVLEYVQMRALSMEFDTLDPPAKCQYMLEEFKAESNPVLQFALDVLPRAQWEVLPWQFLWDLYRPWYESAFNKSGAGFGRNKFYDELGGVIDSHPELGYGHDRVPGGNQGRKWPSAQYMVGPEPMIAEFGLDASPKSLWRNESYHGPDSARRCTPSELKKEYRGIRRLPSFVSEEEDVDDVSED